MAEPPAPLAWRALVVFTTSNRADYVKRCFPHLARACAGDPRLELLVALDGDDVQTREFCSEWEIPLIYSDAREGVGLSKNRVLESFPEYDFYFFLEDDLELLDVSPFITYVELMRAGNIHHMSLFAESEGHDVRGESTVLGHRLVHFGYGSGEFNAFSRVGLKQVGGWHPTFAQYRRWGHTEHSYRYPRNGLAPAPFNVAVDLAGACIRHRPPSVTSWTGSVTIDADGIAVPERELMRQELRHVTLQTLGRYFVIRPPRSQLTKLASTVAGHDRYPLLGGRAKRSATVDFLVWRAETATNAADRLRCLVRAAAMQPSNIALRHLAKAWLMGARRRLAHGLTRQLRRFSRPTGS